MKTVASGHTTHMGSFHVPIYHAVIPTKQARCTADKIYIIFRLARNNIFNKNTNVDQ
jgi:hypothetical protein